MSDTITIRPAEKSDCEAIAALLSQLYREEGYERAARGSDIELALFVAGREVKTQALVAFLGDVMVAALLYYPGYDTLSASVGYHLADIVVAPAHRRQSIGKALLERLAATALAEKKEWLSLTVLKNNTQARAFYQALGMSEVAVDFFAMGATALATLSAGKG